MGIFFKNQKFSRHFLPFCAGIACGIFISVMLFFVFASQALHGQIWLKTNENLLGKNSIEKLPTAKVNKLEQNNIFVHERKLSQDNGRAEEDGPNIIPLEVQPIKDASSDGNLSPAHIPVSLAQELNLKKKLFVAMIHPSLKTPSLFDAHYKTWMKDWVGLGHGDITFYIPMGVNVEQKHSIQLHRLTASSTDVMKPSAIQFYQIVRDICSQHIDTHHNFFIASSNTYFHLPRLLNFTNHVDESLVLWIGKTRNSAGNEKSFLNDPPTYCDISPGLLLTRRFIQQLCPRLETCENEYEDDDVAAGLQFARCALRFTNQTCIQSEMEQFLISDETSLKDLFSVNIPFQNSITVNPVLNKQSLLKLHYYYLLQELNRTKVENEHYYNIVERMDDALVREKGMPDDRLILGKMGVENKYEHPDIITWERIELNKDHKIILSTDSADPSRHVTERDQITLDEIIEFAITQAKNEYGWSSDMSVDTMFRRVVPAYGFQYIVEVNHKNEEVAVVNIDQPYERMRTISTETSPDVTINFILPLQDGSPHLRRFMQMFEQASMSSGSSENVSLLLVLFFTSSSDRLHSMKADSESIKLLNLYKQKYPNLSLRWINAGMRRYSYVDGLSLAIAALPTDSLLCSTNLFVQMSPKFFHHVRLNVVDGERLFFPSPFQQFNDEDLTVDDISSRRGFWKASDYDMFCGYNQDLSRFTNGGENFKSGADLYEQAVASGFDVFRSPEHALNMKWVEQDCKSVSFSHQEQASCQEKLRDFRLSASIVQ